LGYNDAHDVRLPGTAKAPVPFLMYPQAGNTRMAGWMRWIRGISGIGSLRQRPVHRFTKRNLLEQKKKGR
jgi:hypothetical protein